MSKEKTISVRIDDETREKTEYLCKYLKMTQSELMRFLIFKEFHSIELKNEIQEIINKLTDDQLKRVLQNLKIELND